MSTMGGLSPARTGSRAVPSDPARGGRETQHPPRPAHARVTDRDTEAEHPQLVAGLPWNGPRPSVPEPGWDSNGGLLPPKATALTCTQGTRDVATPGYPSLTATEEALLALAVLKHTGLCWAALASCPLSDLPKCRGRLTEEGTMEQNLNKKGSK